jgi:hypothetical protein
MTTPESLLRTAAVAQHLAFAHHILRAYRPVYDEAIFNSTIIRHSLVHQGYDLQARASREGITMTVDMEHEVERLEECTDVIQQCRNMLETVDNWRKDVLLREMEDVERDEAEAKKRRRSGGRSWRRIRALVRR